MNIEGVSNFNFSASGTPPPPRFKTKARIKKAAFGIISRIYLVLPKLISVQTDHLTVSIMMLSFWSLHTILRVVSSP